MATEGLVAFAIREEVKKYDIVGGRVYPAPLPQNVTLPAVTYQRVGGPPPPSAMGSDVGISKVRIQVTCWASTYTAASDAAERVRQAFTRNRSWPSWAEIIDVFATGQPRDTYETNRKIHGVARDYFFWHRED